MANIPVKHFPIQEFQTPQTPDIGAASSRGQQACAVRRPKRWPLNLVKSNLMTGSLNSAVPSEAAAATEAHTEAIAARSVRPRALPNSSGDSNGPIHVCRAPRL
jgi:hypothetical protein